MDFSLVECGTLTAPSNGLVSTMDGTTLGKKAAYACYTGYDLSHTNIRACKADGSWSYTEPTCIKRGKYCSSWIQYTVVYRRWILSLSSSQKYN